MKFDNLRKILTTMRNSRSNKNCWHQKINLKFSDDQAEKGNRWGHTTKRAFRELKKSKLFAREFNKLALRK